ncbi:hypothetical protein MASB_43760 [Mycobacteroides abscessus subsp. bolletii BD]|nr:hypothetical protein MASB_43760 [Mycobacteroides abscessus subsp. bolletii BD]
MGNDPPGNSTSSVSATAAVSVSRSFRLRGEYSTVQADPSAGHPVYAACVVAQDAPSVEAVIEYLTQNPIIDR